MSGKSMQFLFGDRELLVGVADLLSAPVEVIVNPANSGLSHTGGLAANILSAAGEEMEEQSSQLIQEYGVIESGMAMYTGAGKLPYRAVIHAVGPCMGDGDEQHKIEQVVSRSLLLCEANDWSSIAFPAISTGSFKVPVEICAMAFFRSITHFWDARQECAVEKIMVCLTEQHFRLFFDAFREDALGEAGEATGAANNLSATVAGDSAEENIGHVEINEEDLDNLDDDEITDWFH
jgi:O-acetyl-ADP-ribose deacetylase (regulator of RNase III)